MGAGGWPECTLTPGTQPKGQERAAKKAKLTVSPGAPWAPGLWDLPWLTLTACPQMSVWGADRRALHPTPSSPAAPGNLGPPRGGVRKKQPCSEPLLMLRGSRNIICKCFCG